MTLELNESIRIKNKYYIKFIERLLELNCDDSKKYIKDFLRTSKKEKYEFEIFDTFSEMEDKLKAKQKEKRSEEQAVDYYLDIIKNGYQRKKRNMILFLKERERKNGIQQKKIGVVQRKQKN